MRQVSQGERDKEWTFKIFFSLLIILMVSTSTKRKNNKRMLNFFLASATFWICESEQEGVIHNPWPIPLLNAGWAKVTNGNRVVMVPSQQGVICWRWKGSPSILCETGLHFMCGQMEFQLTQEIQGTAGIYTCKYIYKHLWRDRSTLWIVFEKCHFRIIELIK